LRLGTTGLLLRPSEATAQGIGDILPHPEIHENENLYVFANFFF
jgi:hypothetical protein